MISVLMSALNAAETVERAIRSLRAPDGEEMEIICVDDGSTDATPTVLARLAAELPELRVIRNDVTQGLAAGLNLALGQASGEWLARMDADDVSHPDRLERELAFLRARAEYGFVGSAANLFDGDGVYGERRFPERPTENDLIRGNPFVHPTLVFRAEVLRKSAAIASHPKRCGARITN